jgi:ankyrin repeat protein
MLLFWNFKKCKHWSGISKKYPKIAEMSGDMVTSEPIPGHSDVEKGTAWHGISELHRTALGSANDVRSLLLKGADVTVKNNFGETPLHYACQAGNWGGVFQLLLFGANLYDVDKGGRWCIHHAARSGCL